MAIAPTALLAVLGCALAYSGVDLTRKVLAGRVRAVPLLFLLAAATAPFFLGWWVVAPAGPVGGAYWAPGLGSTALNIASNLALLEALRLSPLSLTVPLLSLTPVFTSLLAIPLLGERPTGLQWLGIAAVVCGVLVMHLEAAGLVPGRSLWERLRRERGSLLMIGVALLWSLAMPLDKLAVRAAGPAFHGLVLNLGVGAALLVLLVAHRRLGEVRAAGRHLLLLALAVLGSVAALALQLWAITLVWVGFVETLKRAVGSFLALALGAGVLGERITRRRLAAVALMAAGVALVLT